MSLIRSTGAEARHEKVEAEPEGGEHNMQMGARGSSRVKSSGWGGGGEIGPYIRRMARPHHWAAWSAAAGAGSGARREIRRTEPSRKLRTTPGHR